MKNFFQNLFGIGIIIYLFPTVLLGFLLVLAVVWKVISMLWLVILSIFTWMILVVIIKNIKIPNTLFLISWYSFIISFFGIFAIVFKVIFISDEYSRIQEILMNSFMVIVYIGSVIVGGAMGYEENNKE